MKKIILYSLLSIATLFVIGRLVLTKKVLDEYYIKEVKIRKVMMVADDGAIIDVPESNSLLDYQKIGLGVTINKQFVSSESSKRIFKFVSREPGILGLHENFDISEVSLSMINHENIEIGDFLISKRLREAKDRSDTGLKVNNQEVSFNSFINAMKNNERYVTGYRFQKQELFFWINNDSIEELFIESEIKFSLPSFSK